MTRIVFFTFAGRQANMEIQRPYIEALLEKYPESELHLWDLTREASDQFYLRQWASAHERVVYVGHLHPGHPISCMGDWRGPGHRRCRCLKHHPPYEDPYRYYRDNPQRGDVPDFDDDTVFVKFDDDVLWMDVDRFGEVLEFLETNQGAIASANVVNNAVCAKYEPSLMERCRSKFMLGDPRDPKYDRDWWAMHINSDFAILSHQWMNEYLHAEIHPTDEPPFRTRPGEAVSINFVAMKYPVLKGAADAMDHLDRLGDEGAIDSFLPSIVPNFRVAHLSFGPQERTLSPEKIQQIREQYRIKGDN